MFILQWGNILLQETHKVYIFGHHLNIILPREYPKCPKGNTPLGGSLPARLSDDHLCTDLMEGLPELWIF